MDAYRETTAFQEHGEEEQPSSCVASPSAEETSEMAHLTSPHTTTPASSNHLNKDTNHQAPAPFPPPSVMQNSNAHGHSKKKKMKNHTVSSSPAPPALSFREIDRESAGDFDATTNQGDAPIQFRDDGVDVSGGSSSDGQRATRSKKTVTFSPHNTPSLEPIVRPNPNEKTKEYQQRRAANQTPLATEQEVHEKKKDDRKKAGFVLVGVFIVVVVILIVVSQTQKKSSPSPVAASEEETSTLSPTLDDSSTAAVDLPWTDACTPSGPFATPLDHMKYLKQRVDQLLGYGTRVAGSNSSGYRAVHDMISTMAACDGMWKVETDDFVDDTPFGKKQFSNIVSTFQNGNASLGHLVLSAHFDSKYYSDITFLGACDSAVPCVQLLEIMKSVSEAAKAEMEASGRRQEDVASFISQKLPKITVMFFDGEEAFVEWTGTDNTYGSRHLAQLWKNDKRMSTITLFVLLDLLGPKNPTIRNYFPTKTGGSYNKLRKIELKLKESGKAQTKNAMTSPYPAGGMGMQDDHIPWLNAGVPVLHVIPYPFPSVWHKAEDDGKAMDYPTVYDQLKIFEEFTLTYKAPSTKRRRK